MGSFRGLAHQMAGVGSYPGLPTAYLAVATG